MAVRTVRAVLFDFDGVIADSETLHYQGFEAVARQSLGLTLTRERYDRDLIGYDDLGAFELLCAESGVDKTRVAPLADEKKQWLAARLESVPLMAGAREALAQCAQYYPWAIVSGALRSEITTILHAHRLPVPAVIVAAEDTAQSKPAPDPYLRGAHLMGQAPADCLALEDTVAGCSSALAAGCRVVQLVAHTTRHAQATRHIRGHNEMPWAQLDSWLSA